MLRCLHRAAALLLIPALLWTASGLSAEVLRTPAAPAGVAAFAGFSSQAILQTSAGFDGDPIDRTISARVDRMAHAILLGGNVDFIRQIINGIRTKRRLDPLSPEAYSVGWAPWAEALVAAAIAMIIDAIAHHYLQAVPVVQYTLLVFVALHVIQSVMEGSRRTLINTFFATAMSGLAALPVFFYGYGLRPVAGFALLFVGLHAGMNQILARWQEKNPATISLAKAFILNGLAGFLAVTLGHELPLVLLTVADVALFSLWMSLLALVLQVMKSSWIPGSKSAGVRRMIRGIDGIVGSVIFAAASYLLVSIWVSARHMSGDARVEVARQVLHDSLPFLGIQIVLAVLSSVGAMFAKRAVRAPEGRLELSDFQEHLTQTPSLIPLEPLPMPGVLAGMNEDFGAELGSFAERFNREILPITHRDLNLSNEAISFRAFYEKTRLLYEAGASPADLLPSIHQLESIARLIVQHASVVADDYQRIGELQQTLGALYWEILRLMDALEQGVRPPSSDLEEIASLRHTLEMMFKVSFGFAADRLVHREIRHIVLDILPSVLNEAKNFLRRLRSLMAKHGIPEPSLEEEQDIHSAAQTTVDMSAIIGPKISGEPMEVTQVIARLREGNPKASVEVWDPHAQKWDRGIPVFMVQMGLLNDRIRAYLEGSVTVYVWNLPPEREPGAAEPFNLTRPVTRLTLEDWRDHESGWKRWLGDHPRIGIAVIEQLGLPTVLLNENNKAVLEEGWSSRQGGIVLRPRYEPFWKTHWAGRLPGLALLAIFLSPWSLLSVIGITYFGASYLGHQIQFVEDHDNTKSPMVQRLVRGVVGIIGLNGAAMILPFKTYQRFSVHPILEIAIYSASCAAGIAASGLLQTGWNVIAPGWLQMTRENKNPAATPLLPWRDPQAALNRLLARLVLTDTGILRGLRRFRLAGCALAPLLRPEDIREYLDRQAAESLANSHGTLEEIRAWDRTRHGEFDSELILSALERSAQEAVRVKLLEHLEEVAPIGDKSNLRRLNILFAAELLNTRARGALAMAMIRLKSNFMELKTGRTFELSFKDGAELNKAIQRHGDQEGYRAAMIEMDKPFIIRQLDYAVYSSSEQRYIRFLARQDGKDVVLQRTTPAVDGQTNFEEIRYPAAELEVVDVRGNLSELVDDAEFVDALSSRPPAPRNHGLFAHTHIHFEILSRATHDVLDARMGHIYEMAAEAGSVRVTELKGVRLLRHRDLVRPSEMGRADRIPEITNPSRAYDPIRAIPWNEESPALPDARDIPLIERGGIRVTEQPGTPGKTVYFVRVDNHGGILDRLSALAREKGIQEASLSGIGAAFGAGLWQSNQYVNLETQREYLARGRLDWVEGMPVPSLRVDFATGDETGRLQQGSVFRPLNKAQEGDIAGVALGEFFVEVRTSRPESRRSVSRLELRLLLATMLVLSWGMMLIGFGFGDFSYFAIGFFFSTLNFWKFMPHNPLRDAVLSAHAGLFGIWAFLGMGLEGPGATLWGIGIAAAAFGGVSLYRYARKSSTGRWVAAAAFAIAGLALFNLPRSLENSLENIPAVKAALHEKRLDQAYSEIEKGRYEKALDLLEGILNSNPTPDEREIIPTINFAVRRLIRTGHDLGMSPPIPLAESRRYPMLPFAGRSGMKIRFVFMEREGRPIDYTLKSPVHVHEITAKLNEDLKYLSRNRFSLEQGRSPETEVVSRSDFEQLTSPPRFPGDSRGIAGEALYYYYAGHPAVLDAIAHPEKGYVILVSNIVSRQGAYLYGSVIVVSPEYLNALLLTNKILESFGVARQDEEGLMDGTRRNLNLLWLPPAVSKQLGWEPLESSKRLPDSELPPPDPQIFILPLPQPDAPEPPPHESPGKRIALNHAA